jgi:hypothetical protein
VFPGQSSRRDQADFGTDRLPTDELKAGLGRRTLLQAIGLGAAAGLALPGRAMAAETAAPASSSLVTYPIPDGVAQNTAFVVKVRTPGGAWQPVSCYLATVSMVDTSTGRGLVQNTSMAYFDFAGTVEVMVTYTKAAIKSARIRPLSYGIEPSLRHGDTLTFTLTEPRDLSIEVNDDIFDNLQLFTNPIEQGAPGPDDANVIYFGPGVHTTTGGTLTVPSGQTVYLAGGAVLKSRVVFQNVENARLIGRGVIQGAPGGGCTVEYSRNIEIDGVTMLDPNGYAVTAGQVDGLTIRNLRSFSSKGNGDGIDLFCCTNALIDGVFMRNADDCIAIYAHRWNYYGDTRDVTVRNSTLWADVAHPINIGTHGNTDSPEMIENLTLSNLDILDHREPQLDYQGCIALNAGDSNLISNVRGEDIRVEDFRQGQLVNMRVMYNQKYNTSPGRGIRGVYFKNLSYHGTHANPSILVGYDETRTITDVTFENLVVNGKLISDTMQKPTWYKAADFVPMYANEHVLNLKFLPPAAAQ